MTRNYRDARSLATKTSTTDSPADNGVTTLPSPHAFLKTGWLKFSSDPALTDWVSEALPFARNVVADEQNSKWLRCGGTWFVGVNGLPNDPSGSVGDSGPLRGRFLDVLGLIDRMLPVHWDRAQVSVCYPGYPREWEGESAAAFRYRRQRDAAHVDGLHRLQASRRFPVEQHAFVLGIPLVHAAPGASPLVLWEGSHEIVRRHLGQRLADVDPRQWPDEDVTEAYHCARQEAFDRCRRITLHAAPGECYLVHRLALHGMAPWQPGSSAGPDGRMICYFRPLMNDAGDWLAAP